MTRKVKKCVECFESENTLQWEQRASRYTPTVWKKNRKKAGKC